MSEKVKPEVPLEVRVMRGVRKEMEKVKPKCNPRIELLCPYCGKPCVASILFHCREEADE